MDTPIGLSLPIAGPWAVRLVLTPHGPVLGFSLDGVLVAAVTEPDEVAAHVDALLTFDGSPARAGRR